MAGTVTSQLTNVTLGESGDSAAWDDIGSGQGSSQSSDAPIQGAENRARRADNAINGFSFDNTTTIDISASGTHVGWWANTFQPGQLQTGSVEVRLGGGATPTTSPWSGWTYPLVNWPATGGWVRIWLDPTTTRDFGTGTLTLSSVRQFGAEFDMGNVGGNAANVHLDRIDYTTGGLLINAGTGGSPATFQDFVDIDEGNSSNVYGVVTTRDGVIFCLARLTLGDSTSTVFNDDGFVIVFADQPLVASDFMGITIDLQNASTDIDFSNAIIKSGGTVQGDLIITGTSGAFDVSGSTFDSLRLITLTSACTIATSTIANSGQITVAGAVVNGITVSNSIAASALLWNEASDPLGNIDDITFISSGTGHAIELGSNTPASISFDGHSYSGYAGSDGSTGNEVLYNNSGKAITVNITGGGQTPTVRNGTGASTTVVQSNTLTLTGLENPTEVRVYDNTSPTTAVGGQESVTTGTFALGIDAATYPSVIVHIMALGFQNIRFINLDMSSGDVSIPIQQVVDRQYENP